MPIWVDIFQMGAMVHHPSGDVEITADFVESLLSNFDELAGRGYKTTVLREHGREDSFVYGEIAALRVHGSYVQALMSFYRESEREAFNDGILREFSPGFGLRWTDPHTGESRENVLLEVSFTARAYQRNLRPPQETNPGVELSALHLSYSGEVATLSVNTTPQEASDMEEEKQEGAEASESEIVTREEYSALLSRIEEIESRFAEEPPEDPEEEDPDATAAMSARIAELEAANTRLELSAQGIDGEVASDLVALRRLSDDMYRRQLSHLAAARRAVVQEEIGSVGVAAVSDTVSLSSVAVEAQNAGALNPGRLTIWLSANRPEYVGREAEIRNAVSAN